MDELKKKRASGRSRTAANATDAPVVTTGGNVEAVGAFLAGLRGAGRLSAAHEVLATVALTLAATLDGGAGYAAASISRELRTLLAQLPQNIGPDKIEEIQARVAARRAEMAQRWAEENGDN